MTIDMNMYIVNRKYVHDTYTKSTLKGKDLTYLVSTIAASTHCPAIAVAYWVGEASGWAPEVVQNIRNLIKEYGYTNILGKPADAPV